MYKVFFNESFFLLTDDQKLLKESKQIFVHKDFTITKAFVLSLLEKGEPFYIVLYHDNVEVLFSIFKSCFLYVKAGGGCVCTAEDLLIIKRLGVFDLPKGHQESHETIEQCAVREVEEECGLEQVSITAPLHSTFHIYQRNDCWYLKKTYWYMMSCPTEQTLRAQTEEDIEAVFWHPLGQLDSIVSQTYPSLEQVFEEVKAIVRRHA